MVSVILGTSVGMAVGVTSAYIGGKFDLLVQRVVDTMMGFPGLVLVLIMVVALGPSLNNVTLAIAVNFVDKVVRLSRASALSVKEEGYVMSARAFGASALRIIGRHITPNSLAPIFVLATGQLGSAIVTEAGLSFLGLGVPPPHPSWGNMLQGAAKEQPGRRVVAGRVPGCGARLSDLRLRRLRGRPPRRPGPPAPGLLSPAIDVETLVGTGTCPSYTTSRSGLPTSTPAPSRRLPAVRPSCTSSTPSAAPLPRCPSPPYAAPWQPCAAIGGAPDCTIIGVSRRTSAANAVLANGALIRTLDLNDMPHCSDHIPVALAVGEQLRSSGRDLLAAIVLGYEVQCRTPSAQRAGSWDSTSQSGIIAAAMAGWLRRLPVDTLADAIALSASHTGTLHIVRRGQLSSAKSIASSMGAHTGMVATAMAAEGVTGPPTALGGVG